MSKTKKGVKKMKILMSLMMFAVANLILPVVSVFAHQLDKVDVAKPKLAKAAQCRPDGF